ncbi:uncharacterized protein METZ01_LOCUS141850 [marine metagenome]|uniref:Quinate/shikimate 5-dehydrogenase/glutamyl-tRNA reductase domain-containing protein n=1 Tax=marine metagenome TaxID=408172 RepID=A0A381ZI97_9ZZZZ
MREDLNHLKQWVDEILSTIKKLNLKKNKSEILVFMIGNTSQDLGEGRPYITPIRKLSNGYVFGSIVYSQAQAIILSAAIDGQVDFIFVDTEKKLPINKKPDHAPLEHFGMKHLNLNPRGLVEYGNISSVCSDVIKKSHMFAYKGNDMTIDTTWLFLIEKFRELSGKKILVFGAGNIGNKLALKLVECGCDVVLVTRKFSKSTNISKSLNKIKSQSVLSSISISDNPYDASFNVDAIIGCTNTEPVIDMQMIDNMSDEGAVIDIGKGTIHQDAIDLCNQKGIDIWRLDITAIVSSLISSSTSMQNLLNDSFGRKRLVDDVYIVSGGFMGSKYDIIVDSYTDPTSIIGVCKGSGKVFFDLDDVAKKKLEIVEKYIHRSS